MPLIGYRLLADEHDETVPFHPPLHHHHLLSTRHHHHLISFPPSANVTTGQAQWLHNCQDCIWEDGPTGRWREALYPLQDMLRPFVQRAATPSRPHDPPITGKLHEWQTPDPEVYSLPPLPQSCNTISSCVTSLYKTFAFTGTTDKWERDRKVWGWREREKKYGYSNSKRKKEWRKEGRKNSNRFLTERHDTYQERDMT